jgi:beta-galactosidase GanA
MAMSISPVATSVIAPHEATYDFELIQRDKMVTPEMPGAPYTCVYATFGSLGT